MMKRLVVLGLVAGALALAPTVEAAPILGGVTFAGKATPTGGSNWDTSTGANYQNPWRVKSGTGDYSSVPVNTPTTFTSNITWGSGSGAVNVPIGPVTYWSFSVGGLTYTLTVGTVTNIARGTGPNIAVSGIGTLMITGGSSNFTPTIGRWSFVTGAADILSFEADAVPEPGSMILLGTGLIGLGAAARRRWAKKA